MWRFLFPALAMTGALIVLFAGALGDLKSLPDLSDRAIAIIGGVEPRHVPPQPAPVSQPAPAGSALVEQQTARDALQRQIADLQHQASDLQSQIAQRSHDFDQRSHDIGSSRSELDGLRQNLDAMRTETDKLRQSIDALRQQRKAEEDALARDKTQERQVTAANTTRPPAARPATPSPATSPAPSPAVPSAAQQLLNAQQWLATGRPDEARHILAMVQTQMVLRPVTPDQPNAEGGSPSATDVGAAIRWLDMGANGQAMQAISRAIQHANATEPAPSPWPSNPAQSPGYYPGSPGYYSSNGPR